MTDLSPSTDRSPARKALHIGSGALLLGVGPALALMAASPASAATITVSNTTDSDPGSLRAAIVAAQPGDTIDLSGVTGTITLLSSLAVDKNVTITGPGSENLTITRTGRGGLFYLQDYGSVSHTTTISGMTLSGLSQGRAIHCESQPFLDIKLDDVALTGNTFSANGAGLSADGCGSIEIIDSEFSNNTSMYGGGGAYIKTSGNDVHTVTITGSTFDNNTTVTKSNDYYYSSGGGLWVSADAVDITDSSFTNNYAYYGAAGAFLKAQTIAIDGSDFSLNDSYSGAGGGTGVYMSSKGQTSSATISNSNFDDNTGYMGGGIYANNFTNFTISSSSVSGNSTTYKGAAVLLKNETNNIFNTTMADNEIGLLGGGTAYVTGNTNMAFVTVASNSTLAGAGTTPGLYLHGGTWTVDASIIVDNGDNTSNIKNYNTTATISRSVLGPFIAKSVSTDATDATDVADAGLGTLADNGGSTRTMALRADSVAVDRVTTFPSPFVGSEFDQRGTGYNRITGAFADAGAFEYGSVPPTTTTTTTTTSTSTTTPSSTSTVAPTTTTIPDGGSVISDFATGDNVRSGELQTLVTLTGLTPGSPVTVTIRSEPIVLATGFADADGNFSRYVTIPADTPAGSHAITVSGTDANGNPVERSLYFSLDASGSVTAISNTERTPDPTMVTGGLPSTGNNDTPLVAAGAGLLALGAAGAAFAARRRTA